jgi:hypothetical protein
MKPVFSAMRRSRSVLVLAAAAAVAAPLLTLGTPANAEGVPPPTPQTFAQCPVKARVAPAGQRVTACLVGIAQQGTIDIGNLDTTFRGPGIVDGGVNLGAAGSGKFNWAQALNGKSFTSPRQLLAVPVMVALGNPAGVTPPADSQVWVQAVQVAPMGFGVSGGLVTVVPLAFHMENQLLGPNCWLGSASDPVTLNLTTGASGDLTGTIGTAVAVANHGNTIQTIGTEVVDNTFTVPGATGCGSGGVFDSDIDTTNSLPSAPGASEAILYGNFNIGVASWVARKLGE